MQHLSIEEGKLEQRLSLMEILMTLRVNLRLTHFPAVNKEMNPSALLSNSVLRNHGQLAQLKLVRVVNVMPI